jgi:hypothetical protein
MVLLPAAHGHQAQGFQLLQHLHYERAIRQIRVNNKGGSLRCGAR